MEITSTGGRAIMGARATDLSRLRYIRAANVQGAGDTLEGFEVRDAVGARLGRLAGLIIDPVAERVRYVVVSSWRGIAGDSGVLPLRGARLDTTARAVVMFELVAAVSLPVVRPSCC
jgi:hypothetical protein